MRSVARAALRTAHVLASRRSALCSSVNGLPAAARSHAIVNASYPPIDDGGEYSFVAMSQRAQERIIVEIKLDRFRWL